MNVGPAGDRPDGPPLARRTACQSELGAYDYTAPRLLHLQTSVLGMAALQDFAAVQILNFNDRFRESSEDCFSRQIECANLKAW